MNIIGAIEGHGGSLNPRKAERRAPGDLSLMPPIRRSTTFTATGLAIQCSIFSQAILDVRAVILPPVSHDASFDDCAAGNASKPTYTDFAISPKAVDGGFEDGWIGYTYSCHAEAAWAL